jgi:sulfur carrier protein
MMEIIVNGEARQVAEGTTLDALIASFSLSPKAVIVELSGAIVKREQYGVTMVGPGDKVELIQFVGGG